MASRGSVIPLFVDQIKSSKPISITDPSMTRFMMTLDDAVDLVIFAFKNGKPGDIFVQKAPAASIQILAKSLSNLLGHPDHPINVIGTRHGEKLFECLMSREENASSIDLGDYFKIPPDLRDLNYEKYTEEGESKISQSEEYSSHNTTQLDVNKMEKLLLKTRLMNSIINGDSSVFEE
jgi:UDP-glucose 4-epimerase